VLSPRGEARVKTKTVSELFLRKYKEQEPLIHCYAFAYFEMTGNRMHPANSNEVYEMAWKIILAKAC